MTKKILVPVGNGTEELEAICIVDVLKRAGANVTIASVNEEIVTAAQGTRFFSDVLIQDCVDKSYDLIVLPGGIPGVNNLRDSEVLTDLLKKHVAENKTYAAICAAPSIVLEHHGFLKGKKATCHPGFADQLSNKDSIKSNVVIDGNCITSRGAGTALEFSLTLVEILFGAEKRKNVSGGLALLD
jgi:4-methyl-5(b-hydroxyethyl)-thiazole monophosphate biosynthesis